MQNVQNLAVTENDLAYLCGIGPAKVRAWLRQGCPQNGDDNFNLRAALRWREGRHRAELSAKLLRGCASQKELVAMLGVSRQSVSVWTRGGLPRRADGTFSLAVVNCWLRTFYQRQAKNEYQRRLQTIERKICRNLAQCERFVAGRKMGKCDK